MLFALHFKFANDSAPRFAKLVERLPTYLRLSHHLSIYLSPDCSVSELTLPACQITAVIAAPEGSVRPAGRASGVRDDPRNGQIHALALPRNSYRLVQFWFGILFVQKLDKKSCRLRKYNFQLFLRINRIFFETVNSPCRYFHRWQDPFTSIAFFKSFALPFFHHSLWVPKVRQEVKLDKRAVAACSVG